jgi:hypothetical protein
MTRYKGRGNAKANERDNPHIVEIEVPPSGLGDKLNAMHEWHIARSIQAKHGRGRRDAWGRYFIHWCFADLEVAKSFAAVFGASD